MSEHETFLVLWWTLIVAPPAAAIVFAVMRRWHVAALPRAVIACAVVPSAVSAAASLGISFTTLAANLACISLGYFSFCLLGASAWQIRRLGIRVVLLVLAGAVIASGYVVATLGFLALMFAAGDYARAPHQMQSLEDGLECRVTAWGMAATDSGYEVSLYAHWRFIPMLQRKVLTLSVNQSRASAMQRDLACDDALASYRSR